MKDLPQRYQVWFCCERWEAPLTRELQGAFPPSRTWESPTPGIVWSPISSSKTPPLPLSEMIFARHHLPDALDLTGDSAKDLVRMLGPHVDAVVDGSPLPWSFVFATPEVFTLDGEAYQNLDGRIPLLSGLFLERMERFRKRSFERLKPVKGFRDGLLLQFWLIAPNRLLFGATELRRNRPFPTNPLPWPSERIPEDSQAPCRSFYKVEEAWQCLGLSPKRGQLCVDLGAAPGGWTWSALKRGAKVVAVDAADLAPHVSEHPQCDHRRDNGYEFMPSGTADWLFCDMIVRPLATLGLLERWLSAGKCRGFIINVKFRGKEPETLLQEIRQVEKRHNLGKIMIRHLYFDRNEITLMYHPDAKSTRSNGSKA